MVRGGRGREAERYVMERIDVLPGWSAVDANAARLNQPGFDVIARHDGGRDIHVSVKSKTTGGGRLSFEIGRSFPRHPADVYAFVDTTQAEPWLVYLAGARTVERLALERHSKYQSDRGGNPDGLNSWFPCCSPRSSCPASRTVCAL
jgi:hypothetical protein